MNGVEEANRSEMGVDSVAVGGVWSVCNVAVDRQETCKEAVVKGRSEVVQGGLTIEQNGRQAAEECGQSWIEVKSKRKGRKKGGNVQWTAGGKVMEQGPAAQLFDSPEHPYTRALMAAAFDLEASEEAIEAGVINE